MKIAIPAKGKALRDDVDQRFGRAQYFLIVDMDDMDVGVIENDTKQHGAGIFIDKDGSEKKGKWDNGK